MTKVPESGSARVTLASQPLWLQVLPLCSLANLPLCLQVLCQTNKPIEVFVWPTNQWGRQRYAYHQTNGGNRGMRGTTKPMGETEVCVAPPNQWGRQRYAWHHQTNRGNGSIIPVTNKPRATFDEEPHPVGTVHFSCCLLFCFLLLLYSTPYPTLLSCPASCLLITSSPTTFSSLFLLVVSLFPFCVDHSAQQNS